MKCIIIDDDALSRKVITQLVSVTDGLELDDTCNNAIEAISILNTKKVDLLLLDIEMPGISGLQLIKSLQHPPLIILISSKKQDQVDTNDLNVVDHLYKPVTVELFSRTIQKSKEIFSNKELIENK